MSKEIARHSRSGPAQIRRHRGLEGRFRRSARGPDRGAGSRACRRQRDRAGLRQRQGQAARPPRRVDDDLRRWPLHRLHDRHRLEPRPAARRRRLDVRRQARQGRADQRQRSQPRHQLRRRGLRRRSLHGLHLQLRLPRPPENGPEDLPARTTTTSSSTTGRRTGPNGSVAMPARVGARTTVRKSRPTVATSPSSRTRPTCRSARTSGTARTTASSSTTARPPRRSWSAVPTMIRCRTRAPGSRRSPPTAAISPTTRSPTTSPAASPTTTTTSSATTRRPRTRS